MTKELEELILRLVPECDGQTLNNQHDTIYFKDASAFDKIAFMTRIGDTPGGNQYVGHEGCKHTIIVPKPNFGWPLHQCKCGTWIAYDPKWKW